MKLFLSIVFMATGIISFCQKPKSGTYIYRYCDLEYENSCYSNCKVVIKGDSITVYATKELSERRTYTKEDDIIDQGIILKHKTGKWIIGNTKKDKKVGHVGVDGPAIIDFKEKKYWSF